MHYKYKIIKDNLESNAIKHLLQTHLNLMNSQSPPDSVHALPLDKLKSADITFWSIWDNGELMGCGALKEINPKHGEIKSMHIYQKHRRKGLSKIMLRHIFDVAQNRNYEKLWLETGSQPEFKPARELYHSFGFINCDAFEGYEPDDNSVFMTIKI